MGRTARSRGGTEVILWSLRWYLAFPISYRDLSAMLSDRGVLVDHTTLFRWVSAGAMASRVVANAYRMMPPDTETGARSGREPPLIISLLEAPIAAVKTAQEALKDVARRRAEAINLRSGR